MNRFDRINQLKEMISDLPVRDIAEIYFKKDNRGRFLCPYHNDNNGNSFHLNETYLKHDNEFQVNEIEYIYC